MENSLAELRDINGTQFKHKLQTLIDSLEKAEKKRTQKPGEQPRKKEQNQPKKPKKLLKNKYPRLKMLMARRLFIYA